MNYLKTIEEKKAYLDDKLVPQRIIIISFTANSCSNIIFKSLKNQIGIMMFSENYEDNLLKMKMEELNILGPFKSL